MKKKLLIFSGAFVLLVSILYSCRVPILKTVYGIHDPRIETEQSILKKAEKYDLNKAAIVSITPSAFRTFQEIHPGVPEALIFDKQGNYIEYKATDKSCNAGLLGFIPALDKNGRYNRTGKTTLNTEIASFRDLRGRPLPASYLDPTADFYVLASWACYAGHLNKDHVKAWESLAASNTKAKIQFIEVNIDMQQWWPEQARDSILNQHEKI